ncbi:MAG: sel1 repeat family protein [Gammaproteobacteria bacterium]|nr:sel1 repeat family protein [Gammaproteobacteria bacterium]
MVPKMVWSVAPTWLWLAPGYLHHEPPKSPKSPRSANLEEIFELYARSAELGNAIAQYNLAMMYSNGESVYVDYQQAVYWFKKSAQQEFAPAQYRLGEMYYFEKGGLPRDLGMAVELFNVAAQQHDPDALMNLAMLAGTGEGVPQDTEKAFFWIKQARKSGNDSAADYQKMLATSVDGKFTEDQQTRFWIEKAADLGIREAQIELGILDSGNGNRNTN